MMGQANVSFRYVPERIQPAIDRYQHETRRLLGVLDARLRDHEYLAGDYSIADIANWSWARTHRWSGVAIEGRPHLQRWLERVASRPAVQRGLRVPDTRGKIPYDLDVLERGEGEGAKELAAEICNMVQR